MWGIDDAIAGLFDIGETRIQNMSNAKEATKQRDFQKSMSDSAHQREVADMVAAGINPILSGTGGPGASTPGGAMPTAQRSNAFSAMSASRAARTQVENVQADTDKKKAEKANIEADTANKPTVGANISADTTLKAQQNLQAIAATNMTQAQAAKFAQETSNLITEQFTNLKQRAEIEARTKGIDLENATKKIMQELLQKEMPGLLHAAGLSSSAAGDAARINEMAAKAAQVWTDQLKIFKGAGGSPGAPPGAYKLEPGPPQGGWGSPNPSSAKSVGGRDFYTPRGTSTYMGR
ncbi:DNA pilot protein [Blackfly microvirus SF02]|uniref:DNA pilot protein n=1 Tax=Blackfly microvirus SF02 TaxID=2576452 RepID=A0A4P8PPB2_9VIRU|nr:DNA pilot protein [Blackfly microvirus SF02]